MSQSQASLWRSAAAACARLAAGLAPGGRPFYDASEQLNEALDALADEPVCVPTADFLRNAAAAAAAISALAAARPPARMPTHVAELEMELTRWGSAGFATVSLTRAVFHGCLQGLEARQAYSLASALLLFTNGLPLALVCLWHAVEQLGVQLSELAQEALGLMGRTCTAIAQALSVIGEQLDSCSGSEGSAGGERPAASGGSQPLTVARLLRTTAARPALIIAALRRVTSLLTLCAPSCSGNQRGTEVVANWLGLAACVVTSDVCVEERQMLEQDRDLLLQVSALAGAAASEWLAQADPGSLPVWQWVVTDASLVLCSSCLLSRSLVLLAELDCSLVDHSSGELGGLVLTALQSLQAAMDEATAGGPSAPADAVRALQLAAFAADGLVAVGTAAGPAPVPQDGEPAHAPVHAALLLLTEAELAELQLCLLLHMHSLAPALLAAVGAALQHGVLSPTAGNAHCQRRLKLALHRAGLFLPWLGVAGVQLPKPVLAQCSEAVSSTALAAWLPAARLHLQLHAARDTTFLPGVHLGAFRRGLAEACRGLASKHWETSGLSQHRALAQQRGQQAAGASSSTAGTAGGATAARDAAEDLPALHQLATAVCILSHLAAAAQLEQPHQDAASVRQLFCLGPGEPIAAAAVDQLNSVVRGFERALDCGKRLAAIRNGGGSAASPPPVDGQLGASLLEVTAAGSVLLNALAALPAATAVDPAGESATSSTKEAVKTIAVAAQNVVVMARSCGEAAAAVEAERLSGRALKLLMEMGPDPALAVEGWISLSCFLRLPGPVGAELVASGAVDAALEWLQGWVRSMADGRCSVPDEQQYGVMLVVQSGVAASLLCAAQLLVPALPPAQPGSPPPSDAELLAAAEQQVQQHLRLTGAPAQAAAALLAGHSAADPGQVDRLLRRLVDLVSDLAGDCQEVQALVDCLLPRLREMAAERNRASSATAKELALARCAALRRRRCAHLGCTNVPLLVGACPGGGGEPVRSYKCTGCRAVRFCSEACSRADWRVHRQACRQLAAAAGVAAAAAAGGEQQA